MITLTQTRADAEIAQEANLELNFDQFLAQCSEDGRYELVDGKMLKIPATRLHYDIADLVMDSMSDEIERLNLR